MRSLQRNVLARLFIALIASALLVLLAWQVGTLVLALLLFVALALIVFSILTIAPDAIALQRQHYWRWWWRVSDDEGPFWPGTRIPRHPRPPRR